MEHPTNPMMITVVIRFTGKINYDRLITDLGVTVKRFRRFRQRIVRPTQILRRPYWDDDPAFKVEDHVERLNLPLPADKAAVERLANEKMNTILDFDHPLWKVTLVDNHPDGSIIIVRVHHCIADGISLMRVLMSMTQASTEAPADNATLENPNRDERQDDSVPDIPRTLVQASPTNTNATTGRGTLYKNPTVLDIVVAIARIIFRPPDPPTILKGPLGRVKKAVWSEPFSVPEIKNIARSKGATINDVLMAISTGAIRRYMDLHNNNRRRNIRAFILVNMRGLNFDDELGNKFGLVFLDLPLEHEQPLERLEGVKKGMDRLKASAEYAATYFILNILGMLPEWIEHLATRFLDTKGTVVATNVPGSRRELILADAPIQSIMGWVPQSGRIGVGLSFISYKDQLVVGLNADSGLIPDPEKFLELFIEEFKSYRAVLQAETTSTQSVGRNP
jgi:WS/DGAT/MGAT family acyltransferase